MMIIKLGATMLNPPMTKIKAHRGFLSFLQHKQSMNSSASLTIIPESAQEDQVMEQSGASVKDLVLPADAAVPRSIVHVQPTGQRLSKQNASPRPSCNLGSVI
ncbi:Transmembrane protein 225 [Camelus dromedarius]|uniref:Transmembrane protein 225 n=1 Tax=Camelus dromedarius TaxID=9838 RepID=A0A5N4C7E4_CAMDR|nr:Transmembrane protein 225 [Camelus dromedarius]